MIVAEQGLSALVPFLLVFFLAFFRHKSVTALGIWDMFPDPSPVFVPVHRDRALLS